MRVSGLVEVETTRANQPVAAARNLRAEQRHRDRPALRNTAQQLRALCCRQSGEQSSDPMPGGEERRASGGLERAPFAFESYQSRQRLAAELNFAGHIRHTVSAQNHDWRNIRCLAKPRPP